MLSSVPGDASADPEFVRAFAMSEAPSPEAGNANGEYALTQMTNSPAVIAHLQQLASQAAAQQHLQDQQQQQQQQQQQPGMAPQMDHTMNGDVIQFNQSPAPVQDAMAASGGLSTADLLRHVSMARDQQAVQEQMAQDPVAHMPAASAAQWSGNSLHDLVQRIHAPPGALNSGDLLQAHAGAHQQVISDFVANAQAYATHEVPQQPFPAPDATSDPSEPHGVCLLYTSPSPRDRQKSRMPSSA